MSMGMPMYFPLEAKRDPCSGMKIAKNGQDQLLRHRIDLCSDQSKYYIVGHQCVCMHNSPDH